MNDGQPPFDDTGEKPPLSVVDDKSAIEDNRFAARDEDFEGANDEALAIRLATLEEEHRDLDAAIRALEERAPYERLSIARLKKKKLQLKDQIQKVKDTMLPDIIA